MVKKERKILVFFFPLAYTMGEEQRFGKEGSDMAQTVNVNFKLDPEVKRGMEQACADMGLSMSAAFTIFAKKVSRERRIPFEVSADPFYPESNMAHLRRGIAALNAGKGVEPIEDDADE